MRNKQNKPSSPPAQVFPPGQYGGGTWAKPNSPELPTRINKANGQIFLSLSNELQVKRLILKPYYHNPFGLTQKGYNNLTTSLGSAGAKKYQYNGKELQDDYGLDLYDYGARFYDAQIGRFISADSLADEFPYKSPYDYAENKPINCIDLDGLEGVDMRFNSMSALFNPKGYSNYVNQRNEAIKTIKTEGSEAWQKGIEAGKNSPLKNISKNGYVNGGLNIISGAYVFSSGVGSLVATPETGGLSIGLGIGAMAYGSSQIVYGMAQIMNEATGKKKDLSQGPISLTGAGIDKAAKTNGTFEKTGEILENIINFKTIVSPNVTKVERAVSGTSFILNLTDKNLNDDRKIRSNKKQ